MRFSLYLLTASRGGNETIVKVLLDRGAEINAQAGAYGNAFQAAASKATTWFRSPRLDEKAWVELFLVW